MEIGQNPSYFITNLHLPIFTFTLVFRSLNLKILSRKKFQKLNSLLGIPSISSSVYTYLPKS